MLTKMAQSGLSLVELMIAIVIVGVLMVVGVNSYSQWIQNQQVRVAAESILNGLQLARSEAVQRNTTVQFLRDGQTGWVISAGGVEIQARSSQEGSRNAFIDNTVTTAPATITFDGLGRAGLGGMASAVIAVSSVNAAATRSLNIVVNGGGSVRMCDPTVAVGDPRAC